MKPPTWFSGNLQIQYIHVMMNDEVELWAMTSLHGSTYCLFKRLSFGSCISHCSKVTALFCPIPHYCYDGKVPLLVCCCWQRELLEQGLHCEQSVIVSIWSMVMKHALFLLCTAAHKSTYSVYADLDRIEIYCSIMIHGYINTKNVTKLKYSWVYTGYVFHPFDDTFRRHQVKSCVLE